MSGHTPGPWYFGDGYIRSSHGGFKERANRIAKPCIAFKDSATYMANAYLIAAAPETAAELERARETIAELVGALKGARRELRECSVECTGEDYNNPAMNDLIARAETSHAD